jgi:hypothetical protein
VFVSSRRYRDTNLLASLINPLKTLTFQIVSDPPHSLNVVQSFIIQSVYPNPSTRYRADLSLMLCGIASSSAFHLGLHRPEHSQEYIVETNPPVSKDERLERCKVLAFVYISAQQLVNYLKLSDIT